MTTRAAPPATSCSAIWEPIRLAPPAIRKRPFLMGTMSLSCAIRYGSPPFLSGRSEEHTSELQSLMRISYAVFCLKKKKNNKKIRESNRNVNRKKKNKKCVKKEMSTTRYKD